jgi:hypothetical protein
MLYLRAAAATRLGTLNMPQATLPAELVHKRTFGERDVVTQWESSGVAEVGFEASASFPERQDLYRLTEQATGNPPFPGFPNTGRYGCIRTKKIPVVAPNHIDFLYKSACYC